MVEERKKFADMFKKPSSEGGEGGISGDGSKPSLLDKFGIQKRNFATKSSVLPTKKNEEDQSNQDSDKKEQTLSQTEKIIARKSSASSSFSQNLQNSRSELVFLVRGKDRGREAWHYVFVDKKKKDLFLAAAKTGSLDVAEYGEVLYSGWGKDPPEEIVNKVKERFNIS